MLFRSLKLHGKTVYKCLIQSTAIKEYALREGDGNYVRLMNTRFSSCDYKSLKMNETWASWLEYNQICAVNKGNGEVCSVSLRDVYQVTDSSDESHEHSISTMKIDGNNLYLLDRVEINSEYEVFYKVRLLLDTGEIEAEKILEADGSFLQDQVKYEESSDTIYFYKQDEMLCQIWSYSLSTGDIRKTCYRADTKYTFGNKLFLSPDESKALIIDDDTLYVYVVRLGNGEILEKIDIASYEREVIGKLDDNYSGFLLDDAWNGKTLILPDKNMLHVYDEHGKERYCIPYRNNTDTEDISENHELPHVFFSPGGEDFFFVFNSKLYRCRTADGQIRGSVEFERTSSTEYKMFFTDNEYFFFLNGRTLYRIYCEGDMMGIVSKAEAVSLFDEAERRIYVSVHLGDGIYKWGYYPAYSYEEILAAAKERTEIGRASC